MFNPTFLEKIKEGLPYYDSVNLLSLSNMQEKLYYSAPMPGRVALLGLHFNSDGTPILDNFTIGLTDSSDAPVWTPERVPASAVLRLPTQADQVASFVRPYILEQGTRVQIKLQNDDFTGLNANARITLVGLRLP